VCVCVCVVCVYVCVCCVCVCVCVCVCGVLCCTSGPLSGLFGGLVLSLTDTHEVDTLGRN